MKKRSVLVAAVPVALAAASALLVCYVLQEPARTGGPVGGGADGTETVHRAVPGATPVGAAGPDGPVAAEAPGPAVRRAEEQAPAEDLPPGKVRLAAVDAWTGRPLPGVTARFLSDRRFGAQGFDGTLETHLTPGRWDAAVTRRGYEPARLPGFTVEADADLDLGTVALERGGGWVGGRVRAPFLDPGATVTVELHGPGRGPCPRCAFVWQEVEGQEGAADGQEGVAAEAGSGGEDATAGAPQPGAAVEPLAPPPVLVELDGAATWDREESCPDCGYAASCSTAVVGPGGSFSFAGLAAGTYFLRAFAAGHHPVGQVRAVELEARGHAYVDFAFVPVAEMAFRLVDEAGGAFDGRWVDEDGNLHARRVHFYFYRDDRCVGHAVLAFPLADGDRSRYALLRSELLTFNFGLWSDVEVFAIASAEGEGRPAPVDRERAPEDLLVPPFDEPDWGASDLPGSAAEALFLVQRVPCEPLTVQVESGNSASDRLPVHAQPWGQPPVIVVMREGNEPGPRAGEVELVIGEEIGEGLYDISAETAFFTDVSEGQTLALEVTGSDDG